MKKDLPVIFALLAVLLTGCNIPALAVEPGSAPAENRTASTEADSDEGDFPIEVPTQTGCLVRLSGSPDQAVSNQFQLFQKVNDTFRPLPTFSPLPERELTFLTKEGVQLFCDWEQLYGILPEGTYQLQLMLSSGNKISTLHQIFSLKEAPIPQPEEQAAAYRCFHGLWELTDREAIHYEAAYPDGSISEVYVSGDDFLRQNRYPRSYTGSLEPAGYYDSRSSLLFSGGSCYRPVYRNPGNISSKMIRWEPFTPDSPLGFLHFQDEWNLTLFKPDNYPIAFPEELSLISDKEIRFIELLGDLASGLEGYLELSYHFDREGKLTSMECMPHLPETESVLSGITVHNTSPGEILEKIQNSVPKLR